MSIFREYPYVNYADCNLDYILKHVTEVMKTVDDLNDWKNIHKSDYLELKKIYDDVVAGRFPDSVKNAFMSWMRNNAPDVIAEIMKTVFFGLTDSGYFVAYIPDSWKDIIFNTSDYDIILMGHPEIGYGHLILSY